MNSAVTSRFGMRVWRLFRRPDRITDSTRWLFAILAMVSLLLALPVALAQASGSTLLVVLAAALALTCSTAFVYLSRRVPLWLDVFDAVVLFGFTLACPAPSAATSYVFLAVWFRSFYGRVLNSLARCVLSAGALLATMPSWPYLHEGSQATDTAPVIQSLPLLVVVVAIGRQLLSGLLAREQGMLRDSALAATGSELLGLTDAVAIRRLAWRAMDEICAATPGLRVLKAIQEGTTLNVETTTGEFQSIVSVLPGEVLSDTVDGAVVYDPAPLNAAVGSALAWECIPLFVGEEAWLVVGAPKKIPPAAMLSVRTLVNQTTLALRNSHVHQQLQVQAEHDSLTGLDNRASFTAKLSESLVHRASREGLHVLFLDLDDFKEVNDVRGHRAGDAVLVEVAARLRKCTRPEDVCSRLGGDEFAVVLHGGSDAIAAGIAGRMVNSLAEPIAVDDFSVQVAASVGVAKATPGISIENLVHHADVAMYAAKANGKGRVQVFEGGLLQVEAPHLVFERQLAAAAAAGELVVYYQPIVSLHDLRCNAIEALVRWQHPEQGLLMPDDFIEAAERTGAIIGLGAFVLDRACTDAVLWQGAHPGTPLTVHVNVSATELESDQYLETVMDCLARSEMPAASLVLELTETVVLDSAAAIGRLRILAGLGVKIAIDDFGTGYSSLTTLRLLPINVVKLDTSYVSGALTNPIDHTVIEAIVQMSAKLGMETIAEGVERPEVQNFLAMIGTDSAQGYLYSRAVPAEQLTIWLQDNLRVSDAILAPVVALRPPKTA